MKLEALEPRLLMAADLNHALKESLAAIDLNNYSNVADYVSGHVGGLTTQSDSLLSGTQGVTLQSLLGADQNALNLALADAIDQVETALDAGSITDSATLKTTLDAIHQQVDGWDLTLNADFTQVLTVNM